MSRVGSRQSLTPSFHFPCRMRPRARRRLSSPESALGSRQPRSCAAAHGAAVVVAAAAGGMPGAAGGLFNAQKLHARAHCQEGAPGSRLSRPRVCSGSRSSKRVDLSAPRRARALRSRTAQPDASLSETIAAAATTAALINTPIVLIAFYIPLLRRGRARAVGRGVLRDGRAQVRCAGHV
jgi:hypothetical protein